MTAGAFLIACIAALLGLTLWLLYVGHADMMATRKWVACPRCGQHIRRSADGVLMRPHIDPADPKGRLCPTSDQPIAEVTR